MLTRSILILTLLANARGTSAQEWIQRGSSINGLAGDAAGNSVSMPDANTIAVGSPYSTDSNGQVRVFTWNVDAWQQKGADILGWGGNAGGVVAMPDSNTVGIAAPWALDHYGQVRVFAWNGAAWTPKGAPIDGTTSGGCAGTGLSMPDANTVAISAPQTDNTGVVRVYRWNGTAWVQKGSDIFGLIGGDYAGGAVSMPDPNTIAVGAPSQFAGVVRVYFWNGADWSQKGTDITGEFQADEFGACVSMPDANTVAAGAPKSSGTNPAGQVRVFSWHVSVWEQKGGDITGEAFDHLGEAVSMADADHMVVAAAGNFMTGSDTGYVRVFSWNGDSWAPYGADIEGEETTDYPGYAVCMPDNQTVGIGAWNNDDNGIESGQARVYDNDAGDGVWAIGPGAAFSLYPNPASDLVTLELGTGQGPATVVVRNALGMVVLSERCQGRQRISLKIPGGAGIYAVELQAAGRREVMKLVRE
jgi:hypothetical protein